MEEAQEAEALARRFAHLPCLLEDDADLCRRGARICTTCLIEIGTIPFYMSLQDGAMRGFARGPLLMRSWRFALRGTAQAWEKFWQTVPPPGWHDLFALAKRGAMTIEGDLHPFMAHLQFFKDLLALPRHRDDV